MSGGDGSGIETVFSEDHGVPVNARAAMTTTTRMFRHDGNGKTRGCGGGRGGGGDGGGNRG